MKHFSQVLESRYTLSMSPSGFELPPSVEKKLQRIKPALSPSKYKELREKVCEKGPEFLEEEMKRLENIAEIQFSLESQPGYRESLISTLKDALSSKGIENVLENQAVSEKVHKALLEGKFSVSIEEHPISQQESLVITPEGNISEKLPVSSSALSDIMGL
jgi:hypothetical protein